MKNLFQKSLLFVNIFVLSYFLVTCNKKPGNNSKGYYGTVLSRHNVPMPGVRVVINLGHGEHSGGGGSVEAKTNEEGKFSSTGSICNNCWASGISVATSDSGYFSKELSMSDEIADMVIVLK